MCCRYMKWSLGGGVGLVARCEYDAVMSYHDQRKVFINVKALNEWDPKVRSKCVPNYESLGICHLKIFVF